MLDVTGQVKSPQDCDTGNEQSLLASCSRSLQQIIFSSKPSLSQAMEVPDIQSLDPTMVGLFATQGGLGSLGKILPHANLLQLPNSTASDCLDLVLQRQVFMLNPNTVVLSSLFAC